MRKYFRRYLTKLLGAVLLLPVPGLAASQSLFQGIYLGTFQSPADDGEFALIIDDRERGLFAAYDTVDDDGFTEDNIYIRSDGSFQLVTRQGYRIDGLIADGTVSGRYTAGGTAGVFSARRAADQGPLAEAAGFYSGPVSFVREGSDTQAMSNSRLAAIVAADGRAFFLLDRAFSPFVFGFHPALSSDAGCSFDWLFHWNWGWNWGWNWDWGWDFHIPFFPPIGFDFHFNLPSLGFACFWQHPFTPIRDSGGIIQLAPDGGAEASLPEGLILQGRLDPLTSSGHGTLSQMHNSTLWSGTWFIERHPVDGFRSGRRHHRVTDFDGDGRDDILWRHTVTGENAVWLMDSGIIQAELPIDPQHELNWSLVAADEFNADQRPDLVWQHRHSGELFIWFSDDTESLPIQLDTGWQAVGSGDFFADSQSAILVRHRLSGENGIVVDPAGQAALLSLPPLPDQTWSVAAVANFDGDGHSDILWQNQSTAELLIWRMNGQTLIQELSISSATAEQLELSGVGDFNGDGLTDILRRDISTGAVSILAIIDSSIHTEVNLDPTLSLLWQVAGSGDFDGDGTDDLLWRHGLSGETAVWRIADAQVISSESLTSVADLHWIVQF